MRARRYDHKTTRNTDNGTIVKKKRLLGVLYYKRKENNYKIDLLQLNKTIEELLI